MQSPKTEQNKFVKWFKEHPVISTISFLGTIFIGVSAFIGSVDDIVQAISSIISFFQSSDTMTRLEDCNTIADCFPYDRE